MKKADLDPARANLLGEADAKALSQANHNKNRS
jgi:hypothetical protein